MTAPTAVSQPCVPVSTTETTRPKSETGVTAIGQGQEAAAIDCLITWGWVLGCEGELYPPVAWRRNVA